MIQIKRTNFQMLVKNHVDQLKPEILAVLNDTTDPAYKSPVINYLRTNLEQVLASEPKDLKSRVIPNISYSINLSQRDNEIKLITKAFNYKKFVTFKKKKYGGYALAEKLNCGVCPYCNRQYTFIERGKTRPEFDHFYSQNSYPYLALSFYNLVPSCHICNSSMKGSAKFDLDTHVHPYTEGFEEELRFSIKLKPGKAVSYFYGDEDSFDIILKSSGINFDKIARAENNIKDFRLVPIYNKHKDYVIEIIQKSQMYDGDYLEGLFAKYQGTLFRNLGEVHRLVFANYIVEEDLGKRVLSKLTRDLAEELGII